MPEEKQKLGRLTNEPTFMGEECPFCGHPSPQLSILEAWDAESGSPLKYMGYIQCTKCKAQGPNIETATREELLKQVGDAWNKRQPYPKVAT